jgi:hypothetical protein
MTITKDTAPPTTRLSRGISLAEGRFEEIERTSPWMWSVPSCTGAAVYTVNLKHGACSCPDRVLEGERCKHEHAARYVKARTFTCDGCAERTRYRDGVEVGDGNLTFFYGMWVCEECAHAHGVL